MHHAPTSFFVRTIGIVLLIYVLWQVDVRAVFEVLSSVHPLYFLIALFLLLLSSFIGMLKWDTLVSAQQVRLPKRVLLKYYWIGMFLGMVTPGKLGEFWRARYLVDAGRLEMPKAFGTVLLDRGVDLAVIVMVGAAALAYVFVFPFGAFWWSVAALSVLMGSVYLFRRFWDADFIQKGVSFLWRGFLFLLRRQQGSPRESAAQAKDFFRTAFSKRAWFYGILYFVLTVAAYYALALSLSLAVPFFYLFLAVGLVNLLLLAPITVLGLGTRETSYIFLLGIVHITASEAVAFSTLVLLSGMIVSVPGGFFLLKNVE